MRSVICVRALRKISRIKKHRRRAQSEKPHNIIYYIVTSCYRGRNNNNVIGIFTTRVYCLYSLRALYYLADTRLETRLHARTHIITIIL